MKKEIESMTDHELLCELVRQGRRAEREEFVKTCVVAALLLALIILALVCIPRIVAPIRQLNENMNAIKGTMSQAQEFFENFNGETAEKFTQTMDSLNTTSQQAGELIAKLRDGGLDKLQSALDELNELLDKLKLFGRW